MLLLVLWLLLSPPQLSLQLFVIPLFILGVDVFVYVLP